MTTQSLEAVAGMLSDGDKRILLHERFDPKGWEPADPFNRRLSRLVDLGLFRRADGRCGFEAFKDSFVIPTDLCLALRQHLQDAGR